MKDIYNRLYRGNYNSESSTDSAYKFSFVEKFLKKESKREYVYDMGSGRGFNTRGMLELGETVISVDFSDVIDTYEPAENLTTHKSDIVEFADRKSYDNSEIVCMDVLEHVEPDRIKVLMDRFSTLSPRALYGIANHSDRQGEELHLIREGWKWWDDLLSEYYKSVIYIPTRHGDRFFVFEATR